MEKILIVDGSQLLFQSFYGMPRKIMNKNNENIEAVICFIGIILKSLKVINPTKLLIVFDGENKLERQKINQDYKSNRKSYNNVIQTENPFVQLEIIKHVLNYLKFKWVETTDCEADDYIAGITNTLKRNNFIIISSTDKDFFQLIEKNVSQFIYRGKKSKLYSEEVFLLEYKFKPAYYSSFKSLVGDVSDNISGIKGIGTKTATELILNYKDVFSIIDNFQFLPKRIKIILATEQNKLLENYKLIDLSQKQILIDLSELNYNLPKLTTINILKECEIM